VPFLNDGETMEVQLCLAPNRDGHTLVRPGIDGLHAARR
jgi:hypothetical protein